MSTPPESQPPAPKQCVVAVFNSFPEARDAVQALEAAQFNSDQVSLVANHVEGELPFTTPLEYGDKSESNAAKGAGMGGLVGVLLGVPIITVTGVGSILVAGPLGLGLAGAIVGGFLGAMGGWGVTPNRIEYYENLVRNGHFLVVVHGDPETVADAQKRLEKAGASELQNHAKTSADEVDDLQ